MLKSNIYQNPGNLSNGLAQSLIGFRAQSNSPLSPNWKPERLEDAFQREEEIARLLQSRNQALGENNGFHYTSNFEFWLRAGVAEGETVN